MCREFTDDAGVLSILLYPGSSFGAMVRLRQEGGQEKASATQQLWFPARDTRKWPDGPPIAAPLTPDDV